MEIVSRRISGASVNNRGGTLCTHNQRWGWLDGIGLMDVDACRIYRTRKDLHVLVEFEANFKLGWNLQGRLSLWKGKKSNYPHKWDGIRLRPAKRPVPLP